jgi:hypothetical protein
MFLKLLLGVSLSPLKAHEWQLFTSWLLLLGLILPLQSYKASKFLNTPTPEHGYIGMNPLKYLKGLDVGINWFITC